ncbi:MAG: ribonuclease HIII [Candidatus Zixiibacteriota bacterium]|nr:MAG: ribonuclease HIII [candidate division Zixibacteria bacterium]
MQSDLLLGEPAGLIGIDEAGKGDYFGPLVVAACFSNDKIDIEFEKSGLKESKNISDYRAFILEKKIRKLSPFEIVVIGPEKYNELHAKMRNLNRLLAWGHSRALENLLAKTNPCEVVADQFGDRRLIENALMKKGRNVKLTQKHKAESIPAVAAASVLARAEFLRRLEKLSNQYGVNLHKGAGSPVDEVGRRIVAKHGKEELNKIAKVHFKNTKRIIA